MDISSTFVTSRRLARQSFHACHRGTYAFRLVLFGFCVLVGISMVTLTLLSARPDQTGVVIGCVNTLLGIGGLAAQERRLARQFARYETPAEIWFALSDLGYHVEGPDGGSTRVWSAFKNVTLVRGFWVLKTASQGALAFPANALDATQTETFQASMREKGLLAGR